MFQSEGWLGPMKVVRQGDSDTFTYVLCVWAHQDVQLVLLSSYGFRLAAGASEVDAVYGPVCACHGREGAGVSCRSAEKDCKYKNRCKYKTQKKNWKKQGNIFRTLIHCYWCIIRLLALLNAFILEKTNLEEHNFQTLRKAHRVFKRT